MNKWIQQEQVILDKTVDQLYKNNYEVISGAEIKFSKISSTASVDGTVDFKIETDNVEESKKIAITEPFFGRIDIEEDRKRETLYIGKRGIKDQNENIIVIDWRRPIASIYYNFISGLPSQTYKVITPNGEIRRSVEVLKKRQFTIEKSKIVSIHQEGPHTKSDLNRVITNEGSTKSNPAAILYTELEKSSSNGFLKEIIATIQTEQNAAIRKPLDRNLIIQGVAGSGKSSIALHRMSYLLYNHSIKPEDMLIIAPSELFLSSIKNLLPNLELNGIEQSTFERLAIESLKTIGIELKSKSLTNFFESMVYNEQSDDEFLFAKLRSSEQMQLWIDEYVDSIKAQSYSKIKPFSWNQHIISLEEMNTVFKGYSYLPLDRQLKSYINAMNKRFNEIYVQEKEQIEETASNLRLNYFKDHNMSTEETSELQELLRKLEESKLQVLDSSFTKAITEWESSVKQVNLFELYNEMWDKIQLVYNSDEEVSRLLLINHNELDAFDTAPLLYLAIKLGHQFPTYTHVVVDEAQDLSYIQLRCLKAMTKTMTIIGDTNQSLLMDCGQMTWNKVITSVYRPSTIDYLEWTKSYRSTAEIIEVAKTVLASEFPKEAQSLQSVNRNGAPVRWKRVSGAGELIQDMTEVLNVWSAKYKRICIIAKDTSRAKNLVTYLQKSFPDAKLVTPIDEVVTEGVFVMAAHEIKGMEFDAIYLMNVDSTNYPQSKFYAKLLYTLITRAQQELAISYYNTPSQLIENFIPGNTMQMDMFEGIL